MSENNGEAVLVRDTMDERDREIERWKQKCTRLEAHVSTLKEVAHLRQNLLDLRDKEIKDMITRLKTFEGLISRERASRIDLNERVESAEKACNELTLKLRENIEKFNAAKTSYEEKVTQLAQELEKCDRDLQKRTGELNDSELRNIELNSRLEDYNKLILENEVMVKRLTEEMRVVSERNEAFSVQMNMLNTLFTEIEGTPIDFERIRAIGDIVRESRNLPNTFESVPALPEPEPTSDNNNSNGDRRSSIDFSSLMDHMDVDKFSGDIPGEESCYKKVLTVDGPKLVLSVSQTFIKLKDLILEKKHLQKEIETLKQLHSKLESKVDRQERRLYIVTTELNRTWNLVAKLKMQHNKLHNSEAVLRYELHEKRKLLEKLKIELARSRQQYAKVRAKHDESEELCQIMRAEFARRRQASSQDSGAVSAASSSPCSSPSGDHGNSTEEEEMEECTVEGANEDIMADISAVDNEELENEVDPIEELVDDLVQEIEAVTSAEAAETAQEEDTEDRGFISTSRANRLRQLEDASRVLYSRLMATTVHGTALASRLAQLHDHYGSPDDDGTGGVAVAEEFELVDDGITVDAEVVVVPFITSAGPVGVESTPGTQQFEPLTSPFTNNTLLVSPELGLAHAETVSSLSQSDEHLPVMAMTQAEALIMDVDSPQILAELAFTTIETRPLAILQATTTQIYNVGATHPQDSVEEIDTDIDDEFSNTDETGRDTEASSSPDLSRLIIQQVPKRLERLKSENEAMKEREQSLLSQVDEQRLRIESLETENKSFLERLNQEISLKEEIISSLRTEMADLVSRMNREKDTLATFMKTYLEEKSELESPSPPPTTSNCHKCAKKFSLLKRRRHTCRVCKRSFCQDCSLTDSNTVRNGKRRKICFQCRDRQAVLRSTAQSFL